MALPIWKDTYITLGSADSYYFRISTGGNIIYQGKAYKRPGEASVRIRINDICSDYLSSPFPLLADQLESEWVDAPTLERTFIVSRSTDGVTYTNITPNTTFVPNWTYLIGQLPHRASYSPLGTIARGRDFCYTILEPPQYIAVTFYFLDGGESEEYYGSEQMGEAGHLILTAADLENVDYFVIEGSAGAIYTIVDVCDAKTLHYLNAYGGWDSILLEGNIKERDTLKRYEKKTEVNNGNTSARATTPYVEEIAKTYELRTGWLNDSQAEKVATHLIPSLDVYLEVDDGVYIPVNINDTSVEHKTFKNNGNKMLNYTLNLSLAQNRIRK